MKVENLLLNQKLCFSNIGYRKANPQAKSLLALLIFRIPLFFILLRYVPSINPIILYYVTNVG